MMAGREKVFLISWFGQSVSVLGTGLTEFALGVFVYQLTESVIQFALVMVFATVPAFACAPVGGVLAVRLGHRRAMVAGNVVAGMVLLLLATLIDLDALRLWHVYAAVAVIAVCGVLRDAAGEVSIDAMMPRGDAGPWRRLVSWADAVGMIAPPVLSGFLFVAIGLRGVLIIDLVTCVFAVAALLSVRFPRQEPPAEDMPSASLWRDTAAGWRYTLRHTGFLHLFLLGSLAGFFVGLTQVVMTPMILSFASPAVLGILHSSGGLGIFLGGMAAAALAPRRLVRGVLIFGVLQGIALLVLGFRAEPVLIAIGVFGCLFAFQFVRSGRAAVIRTYVPRETRSRVLSLNRVVAWVTLPLAYLLAGPLVNLFAPGRGMGLLLMTIGGVFVLVVLTSAANSKLRNLEREMPDVTERELEARR